jgi:hypothetical protein
MSEYESTLANVKGGITKHNAIDQSRLIEVRHSPFLILPKDCRLVDGR